MRTPKAAERDLVGLMAAERSDLPEDVAAGLARLDQPPLLWPADRLALWSPLVAGVVGFARRWDGQARACGWTTLQLYGLHRQAPWANLAAMGAAFSVASGFSRPAPFLVEHGGGAARAVGPDHILIVAPTGSRLRIYRRPPDPGAVLAWELKRRDVP